MRILLVEDEPNAAQMLAKGLRKQTYAVDVARDGQEAVHQASVNDYDLIILDVMLPLKDGFEVCGDLRAGGSSVPILMLTTRDAVQDRIAGLDTGADDYLTKPFDFHELLARARALLRRGRALRPETIEVADLRIDTRSHEVWRGGELIELTAKEYALLEYLARRAGSEQEFFFFGMEGNIENAQSVCLHRHGLIYSARQLNAKGDKSGAWRLALQCREDSEIEPRNFELKTLTG